MYQRNGTRGIFSGLVPRMIKVAPACAIMVSTFEYGKKFFQKRNMQVYYENGEKILQLKNTF